ncbi:MAG: chemotaxis protein CheW [Thiotrichaceae bacterium]
MMNVSTNGKKIPWLTPSDALNRPLNRQSDPLARTQQVETMRRLGFHVGNIGLLIGEHAISELVEPKQVCAIPNTASWLLGLINLRGNLVPVFDLNMLLNIERKQQKKRMLLILGSGEYAGAILLDELPIHLVFTLEDKLENLPPLPQAIKPFTHNGYEKGGEVWFSFDHHGFFESLSHKIAI